MITENDIKKIECDIEDLKYIIDNYFIEIKNKINKEDVLKFSKAVTKIWNKVDLDNKD